MGDLNKTTEYVQKNLDWNIGKSSSEGIRVDLDAPSFPWHDLIGQITPDSEHRSTSPELFTFIGGVRRYAFQANRLADVEYHIPHDYVLGSDMFIHAHWGHNGTDISGINKMQFEITTAKRTLNNPCAPFVTPVVLEMEVNPLSIVSHPQYCHAVDEIQMSSANGSGGMIDTADLEVDGLIMVHFKQLEIPTILNSVNADLPFVMTIDIHYQSTGVGTKSSAPNYYA